MEGNFYISDVVISRALKTKYGAAYEHCRPEAKAYGVCVEAGQINRDLEQNSCLEERRSLRQCVDAQLKRMGRRGLEPHEMR